MKKLSLLASVAFLLFACKKDEATFPEQASNKSNEIFGVHEDYVIAHWPFNGNGTDTSGKGNHATLYNLKDTTDRFGNPSGALYFNGVDGYASVEDTLPLRLANTDFTLSAWVKIDENNYVAPYNILLSKKQPFNYGWYWGFRDQKATDYAGVMIYVPGTASNAAFSNGAIGINNWHMITLTYHKGKQRLGMYIDGVLNKTTTGIKPVQDSGVETLLYIGRNIENPYNGYFFKGTIDDIRMYRGRANEAQVMQLFGLTE